MTYLDLYKKIQECFPPPQETPKILYKYLTIQAATAVVKNLSLRFTPPDEFDDIFELEDPGEILAIFAMPLLIKKFRRPEVVSVGGSATINSCVAAATVSGDNSIVLYGILVGSVISLFVPLLIGFLTGL